MKKLTFEELYDKLENDENLLIVNYCYIYKEKE